MSSAHDAHGASAHAHDDHHAFDGEPAQELSPGEPTTPAWLPAVGLLFFSGVAVYLLASGDASGAETTKPQPEAHAQVQAQAPAAAPAPAPAPRGGEAAPAGSGIRRLTPDQIEEFKKRIEEAHAKEGGAPAAPGAPGAPAKGLTKIEIPPGAKAPPAKQPPAKAPPRK